MALDFNNDDNILTINISDDVLKYNNDTKVNKLLNAVKNTKKITFKVENLKKWDSSLSAVLYQTALMANKYNTEIEWQKLPENLQRLLKLALAVDRKPTQKRGSNFAFFEKVGEWGLNVYADIKKVGAFLHEINKSFLRLLSGKAIMRKLDLEFALEDCGYKAAGIVSLVSFMVGLILAFVGALQLKMFGAEIYIASLVTIGMTRIMGAIMCGIIMAGRTGASYAATIGTMQVNEEVDALKTFGFEVSDFLILPRMLSLIITMPLLTMLSDFMGMIGGAFVAVMMMDISAPQYWQFSIDAFAAGNFLVGIFHGLVYGIIISSCGCYYGINCGRKADSVGVATTKAVVSSIVIMIVTTGILTAIFEVLGI